MFLVNKSFLKFATDFGPLAIFFFYYYSNDKNLSIAIPPLIIATIIALIIVWLFEKKIPPMPLLSGILISNILLSTYITFGLQKNIIATFVKPKYSLSIVVEHGGGGGKVAAPIARDVLLYALSNAIPSIQEYPIEKRNDINLILKNIKKEMIST